MSELDELKALSAECDVLNAELDTLLQRLLHQLEDYDSVAQGISQRMIDVRNAASPAEAFHLIGEMYIGLQQANMLRRDVANALGNQSIAIKLAHAVASTVD